MWFSYSNHTLYHMVLILLLSNKILRFKNAFGEKRGDLKQIHEFDPTSRGMGLLVYIKSCLLSPLKESRISLSHINKNLKQSDMWTKYMHFYAFCTTFWSLQQIHNLWIYHKHVCSPQICIESEAGVMSWVYHNGTLLSLQPDAKIHPSFPKTSYVSAAPCLILHIQKFHFWGETDHAHKCSLWSQIICRILVAKQFCTLEVGIVGSFWVVNKREHWMPRSLSAVFPFYSLLLCPWEEPAFSLCNIRERKMPSFSTCWSH